MKITEERKEHTVTHNDEYYTEHGKDVYSIQSLLARLGVLQADTIYKDSANDVVRWPFCASDFFKVFADEQKQGKDAELLLQGADKAALEKINAEIKSYKAAGETILHKDRIKELRVQKKALLSKALAQAGGIKYSLMYRSVVEINDSGMVERKLPYFKHTAWQFRDQMPYFTAGLEPFAQAVARGEPTAITGGPCFFSEYEVDMVWTLKDGSQKVYDFITGRRDKNDSACSAAEFLRQNAADVSDVSFVSRKAQLTTNEYDSILYLFELAKATNSCLTVPIPDFSYEKQLAAIVSPLPAPIQEKAVAGFRTVARPIIALYRELFDFFKESYHGVRCVMISADDTDALEQYYEKRKPFVEKPAVLERITGVKEKFESVKDYITLPALPFYLWGVKNVLEVDYLGETDSFRKCREMHKGTLNLSALLYPIQISADGWRTLFSTEMQYKHYIARNEYGTR